MARCLACLIAVGLAAGPAAADVAVSPDGYRVVAATPSAVAVYDLATGRRAYTLTAADGLPASRRRGDGDALRDIAAALTADGKHLVTASARDDRVRVWDAATGRPVRTVPLPDAAPGDKAGGVHYVRQVRSVAGCPAARVLLVEADNGHVFTLDPTTWALTYRVQVRYELESASADGTRLAVNDPQESVCDSAYVYDGMTGKLLAGVRAGGSVVAYQVLSADGRRLAAVGDWGRLGLWESATEKPVRLADAPAGGSRCGRPAFTPDGKVLLVPVGRFAPNGHDAPLTAIARWETATGKRLPDLAASAKGITGVVVSPNGRRIVTAGSDGAIHRFDATSGELLPTRD